MLLSVTSARAAERDGAAAELQALVARIEAKRKSGESSAAELRAEGKEFDVLIGKYGHQKTDAVANILVVQAGFCWQVLDDFAKARQVVERLKREFPRTAPGRKADELLISIGRHAEAKRVQGILVIGVILPDFNESDVHRQPLSIAQYRGKIVLVEFGATWSPAWVVEVPNLRRIYEEHRKEGFEIIAVSLDQDRLRLSGFTKQHKLPWPQFCDARGWNNKLALQYGISRLPANYLLDRKGRIVAKNLRGQALAEAVAKVVNDGG